MTDTSNTGTIEDLFRSLGQVLNKGLYFLLATMYQIFFNVASAQLFENETIKNFYARIQLIIGVFMIFKLTISILQGIMDPDKFTNPKEGFGSIITRVIIALVMLTLIVPINIPNVENANSLEKYINNNGILFGALYSLQDRILTNNTLGSLILGTNSNSTSSENTEDGTDQEKTQNEKVEESANIFASTILKGFLRINMLPEDERAGEDPDDETDQANWYCGSDITEENENGKAIQLYSQLDIDPSVLLSDAIVKADCSPSGNGPDGNDLWQWAYETFTGDSVYVFVFEWLWALVVGAVFLVILVGFTVDIAIRAIKLSILRLLAPIPIISYIEPKSSKDGGMFSSWVSALTSTYLDLFLRLAIVYFVIFLIQDMIVNGIIINEASGVVGLISTIFIWIGLFFFAKMAPKFIKDVLGLKGTMSNVGLSGILGGAAALTGGAGLKGALAAGLTSSQAAAEAAGQGKAAPPAWQTGADLAAQIKTGDAKAKGGLINSLNDRLVRDAGINRARKLYGVTANGLAQAKDAMYSANDEASRTEDLYNRFTQGHMDDYERSKYARDNQLILAGSREEQDEIIRNDMYKKMGDAQTKAAKAKSHYEDAKKFADLHRINPSFEEEHRWSLSERVGLGDSGRYRADYRAESGRYTAHQTLGDRIFGSPEKWDTAGSRRGDNRWDPNKFSDSDRNVIQDDGRSDTNTPSV